jgi:hypothetical protein
MFYNHHTIPASVLLQAAAAAVLALLLAWAAGRPASPSTTPSAVVSHYCTFSSVTD